MSKTTFTRIINKHDLEANWIKAVNFTPLSGELIIYDVEVDSNGNTLELPSGRTVPYTFQRLKIGDGVTNVNSLPFAMSWSALSSCEEEVLFVCGTAAEHIEPEPEATEQLEGTGQEFYTMAPSTMSFRSTAPLDEFQEVQVNGETVDPSNYTLEEGSTIVKLSHKYLSTLGVGKHEVAIVSDSKTVKGDFIIKSPELNEYGFYYNQPYYGDCFRTDGGIIHFGGPFVIMFKDDGMANLYQLDSSNTYNTTFTFADGKISFLFYNDQSDPSPFTGSFSVDGKVLTGTVVVSSWGMSATFDDIVLELTPEQAACDDNYIYYRQYTQYAESDTWEYFPTTRGLTEYPAARNSILNIAVTGIAYEAFQGFTNAERVTIGDSVTSIGAWAFSGCSSLTSVEIGDSVTTIGGWAFSSCNSLTNIIFNGTTAQWNAITKHDDWNSEVPATYVQCSDGQVAI